MEVKVLSDYQHFIYRGYQVTLEVEEYHFSGKKTWKISVSKVIGIPNVDFYNFVNAKTFYVKTSDHFPVLPFSSSQVLDAIKKAKEIVDRECTM